MQPIDFLNEFGVSFEDFTNFFQEFNRVMSVELEGKPCRTSGLQRAGSVLALAASDMSCHHELVQGSGTFTVQASKPISLCEFKSNLG